MDDIVNQAIQLNQWNNGKKEYNKNRYTIIDNTVIFVLTQGKYGIIDIDDISLLDSYIWCYHQTRGVKSKDIMMHRLIMKQLHPDRTSNIVHISGDWTDNRRSNLSFIQRSTQLRANNKSGYMGISFSREKERWIGSIMIDGILVQKQFLTKESAIEWRKDREIDNNLFV